MPKAKPVSSVSRVIAHVDMDCFYVQVEQRKQPQLRGLPTAVVQYNEWKGGGLIAVSYEARKHGVKRSMRGDEAKSICPQIQLVRVPVARGKAELSSYRDAGSEVVSILSRKGRCERASIDEVYLDLTDAAEVMLAETPPESLENMDEEALKSHILGVKEDGSDVKEIVKCWLQRIDADYNDKLLSCGALIVAELRKQVLRETEFTCSAGIAHNKMLAKLASGLHKPAQQTIVPSVSVKEFLGPWPIKKMKQLGGKLGDSLQTDLGVNTVGELLQFSESKLQEHYGLNTGTWLWNIARGFSGEEVQGRILPKSHGSGKTFPGPRALRSIDRVSHWLKQLCEELSERLMADWDQNKRTAHTLTLHVKAYKSSDTNSQKKFPSKSCPLRYGVLKVQEDALSLFHAGLREYMGTDGVKSDKYQNYGWGVTSLSVSASKLIFVPQGNSTIKNFFSSQSVPASLSSEDQSKESMQDEMQLSGAQASMLIETEENAVMHDTSGMDQNEEERKSWKDQKAALVHEEGTCCSLKEESTASCSYIWNNSSLSDQPTHSCSISDQAAVAKSSQPTKNGALRPSVSENGSPAQKLKDQDVRKSKAKGTPSILTFLKTDGHSSSQSRNPINEVPQEINTATSSGGSMLQSCQNASNRERWNYNVDEIDPSVVEELPADIRDELLQWIGPLKNHSAKRSIITSYFLPSKVSKQ